MINLRKLIKGLKNIEVRGQKDIEISGICQDSKVAAPKNLFIARKGKVYDGTHFIPEAISAGVNCVLTDIYNPFFDKTTQLICTDMAEAVIEITNRFYDDPGNKLFLVGITGTSGKTTTSYLIKHILDQIQKPAGVIGTNGYIIGNTQLATSSLTTPDTITCVKLLKEMVAKELTSAVMEVSSHALDQDRVSFLDFDVAIFTNISHEHLDYHGNMEEYIKCKSKLFSLLEKSKKPNKCAILNADSTFTLDSKYSFNLLTYGVNNQADVMASNITLSSTKSQFFVSYKDQKELFDLKLIGRFNIYNALAAISTGIFCNISLKRLSEILSSFTQVEGRLDLVKEFKKCNVFIDYAHKPDALENVLQTLKEVTQGKLITVFGCGGNRDRLKRPKMANISEKYSDFSIVTNDNPRNEDPQKISDEILLGFSNNKYLVELDRKKAIEKALEMAGPLDVILIAGKGHEKVQIFSHKTVSFDDRQVILDLI